MEDEKVESAIEIMKNLGPGIFFLNVDFPPSLLVPSGVRNHPPIRWMNFIFCMFSISPKNQHFFLSKINQPIFLIIRISNIIANNCLLSKHKFGQLLLSPSLSPSLSPWKIYSKSTKFIQLRMF